MPEHPAPAQRGTPAAPSPRSVDWFRVALILGFIVVPLLPILGGSLVFWIADKTKIDPNTAFARSLADAAINKPGRDVTLATIDVTEASTKLVNFTFAAVPVDGGKLQRDIWVSQPAELRRGCKGAPDENRNLEQMLGLAPAKTRRTVYDVMVNPRQVFRPCLSGPSVTVARCGFEPAEAVDLRSPPASEEEKARQDLHYVHLRFMAGQILAAHRTGFPNARALPGDYPYSGAPFTGMGWTYNWDPSAPTPVGVSEFVIPRGTPVTVGSGRTAEMFCREEK